MTGSGRLARNGSSGISVAGGRLAYREAGSGSPLLLVHGNFASGAWFGEQLAAPPAGWRLLAPDLPNFGRSAPLDAPIAIATYAARLEDFADALGLERFALLGHSLGGAVAMALAVRRPERIERLMLVSSAPPYGLVTPEAHYPLLESLRHDPALMERTLAATAPTRRPDWFGELVEDALGMHESAYRGNARALAAFDLGSATAAVACPVLVLRCELDTLIDEAAARRTAAAFPGARLELWSGVGHSPQLEDPERFAALLVDFLGGAP